MLLTLAVLFTATVIAAEPVTAELHAPAAIAGTVTLTDARGETFDAPGVQLTLTCETMANAPQVATSDEHGAFRFADVPPDRCSIAADLPGFGGVTECAVVRAGETLPVTLHLEVAASDAGIRVVAKGDSGDRKDRR
jgi:Carboxypeptidase regulatory-like domain